MTLRLAQIPEYIIEANELSRPQARQLAREGRLLADGRGILYEIDSPDMVGWAPWNRLTPVVTSTTSEDSIVRALMMREIRKRDPDGFSILSNDGTEFRFRPLGDDDYTVEQIAPVEEVP